MTAEIISMADWTRAHRQPALVPALAFLWGIWPVWMLVRV